MPTPIEINGWSAYNHVSSSGSTKKSLLMINPSPDFLSRILYTWLVIFGAFFITKREGLLFCRSLPKESRKKNKLYNTSTQPRNPISIGSIAYYSRAAARPWPHQIFHQSPALIKSSYLFFCWLKIHCCCIGKRYESNLRLIAQEWVSSTLHRLCLVHTRKLAVLFSTHEGPL